MGTNAYAYAYDPIGDQKSAKPKAQPPGDRDFEAVRMHGARSGIPRRSGNCNRMQSAVAVGSGPSDETAYLSNPLNQYTNVLYGQSLVVAPAYDPDGNMLTNGPWAYTWDAENRLASAVSNGVLLVTNVYDHQSRRIRKSVYATSDLGSPISDIRFLYDGWNVVRETVAVGSGSAQSVATNYYTWGLDLSGTMQGAGGVGGLLAVTCVSSGTSNLSPLTYYPLYDANGNITAYVDATGDIAASREFDAFGNTVSLSGPMADGFAYWFSTKYLDIETRLYYYGYRFYHPEHGRWLNRDPIGEIDSIQLYEFVDNEPTCAFDDIGLAKRNPGSRRGFPIRPPVPRLPEATDGLPPVGNQIPTTPAGSKQEGGAGLPGLLTGLQRSLEHLLPGNKPQKRSPDEEKERWDAFWEGTVGPCMSQAGNTVEGQMASTVLNCMLKSLDPYNTKECIVKALSKSSVCLASCCIGHAYANAKTPADFSLYDRCEVKRCACIFKGKNAECCRAEYGNCISGQDPSGGDTWH